MAYQTAQVWYSWTGDPGDLDRDYVQALGVPVNTLVKPPMLMGLFLRSEGDPPCPSSILVRREVIERVGGFEDAFRGLYEDQVFLSKICLELPVFVASGCACKYRQHEDSMVKTALRTGQHAPARLKFLVWLSKYLEQRRIRDNDISVAVKRQLWLWWLLSAFPLLEKATNPLVRLSVILAWIRLHLKTSLIWVRLRSIVRLQPLNYSSDFRNVLLPRQHYAEQLLNDFASNVRGNILRIENDSGHLISSKIGGPYESVHKVMEDLAELGDLQNDSFDCIVCTDVLQTTSEPHSTIAQLYRILRTGGVLLVTSPLMSGCGANDVFRPTAVGLSWLSGDIWFWQCHGWILWQFYGGSR